MKAKKRISVFTIPNEGHLNILKKMISQHRSEFDFQLIIIGAKNTKPDIRGLEKLTVYLKKSPLFVNTPADKVLQRVYVLLEECLEKTREFKPDIIIYDFPAIEGYFVGKILHIPAWSSIPGMMGPYIHKNYLEKSLSSKINQKAKKQLEETYHLGLHKNDFEVISNCLHIPGKLNLVWSYPSITPSNFLQNRKKAKYVFIGYIKTQRIITKKPLRKTIIYFSLGTEVMDNLWVNQPVTRKKLKRFIADIASLWKDKDFEIYFITQGKKVLPRYPKNWKVFHRVDQQQMLSQANVFITHGGSNSFHEALLYKIPMILIPFFGDQPLVSKRAEELGIGINVGDNLNIERGKPKNFLNNKLVQEVDRAINYILQNKSYYENFDKLHLQKETIHHLLKRGISAVH